MNMKINEADYLLSSISVEHGRIDEIDEEDNCETCGREQDDSTVSKNVF